MIKCKISNYEVIAASLLVGLPKAKPTGKLIGTKFYTGTKSLHLSQPARTWRLFWRLKVNLNSSYKSRL